jgi:gluconolactonase
MKATFLIGLGSAIAGAAAVVAQGQPQAGQTPGLQAAQDPRYPALIATCKNPPPAPAPPAGAGAARGAAAPAVRPTPADYTVAEIPGVIAAGQRWKLVWETRGNNADGIVGTPDGGLLIAQNDNRVVIKLDKDGKPSTAYRDTNTGGALSMSSNGALFIAERGLNSAILQLAPKRQILANKYQGDPFDCVGGLLNDLTADGKGGVYFTMNGLFYADPKGVVTKYGENLRTNGLILSPDEKTLYVTDASAIAAFDVQPDGSLKNQREFAKLPSGNADGATVDAAGRLYVTGGAAVHVIAPDGKYLGNIPAPGGLTSVAFSGPDKKTLHIVFALRYGGMRDAQIYAIETLAQGYKGRAK